MKNGNQEISKTEKEFYKREKKSIQPSPDITKMQMVQIDDNTTIYIAEDASVVEARTRYENYILSKKMKI